jgi:hypothetical protein
MLEWSQLKVSPSAACWQSSRRAVEQALNQIVIKAGKSAGGWAAHEAEHGLDIGQVTRLASPDFCDCDLSQ